MANYDQTLLTYEKALKNHYLPVWNDQLGIEPSAFLAKIKKVPLVSNQIVAGAPIGLSGGFGFSAEGQATPASGNVVFQDFKATSKDMYVNITISQKAVELTKNGGAMANALTTEVEGAYDAAKWNVGRSLFGNGTGKLAAVSAINAYDTTKTKLTLDSTDYVKEGLIIDAYNTNTLVKGEVRIEAVDRVNKTITINVASSEFTNTNSIYVQHSKDREITGLGAIFDSNISTIYGVSKTANPYLNPISKSAGNDVDDSIITNVLRQAERDKNSKVDLIMAGDDAYDHYVSYLRENNIRVESQTKVIEGGFKAIKFLFGNREVDIVNESFVPSTSMWGVDTSVCEMHQTDWKFADLRGGGIFNLMEGKSIYRALLTNYGELIVKNPGGCVEITNCA